MSLRYDESLNLTPSFKTQDTQLTAVPQKRLLFYLPPSFGKVFTKLSAKTKKNIKFWQVIYKIICQNRGKYRVLASYLQNYLPKLRKISSFGKVFWIASGRYGGKFVNSQFNGRGVR